MDNILRTTIRSWGFFWLFCISNIFGGGYEVVCWTWGIILIDLVCRIRPDLLGGLPIFAGLPRPFGHYLMTSFLWNRLGPVVHFWKVLEGFHRDCFMMVIDILGSLLPYFWYCLSLTNNLSWGYITLYSMEFFCFRISSCSVEEERLR